MWVCVCVRMCMFVFCNICVFVSVGFVKFVCLYVWIV